jgi:hypothetical protein
MLRRQPKDAALLDAVDLQLLEGVDRGLSWSALIQSSRSDPDEAALRIMRLIQQGHLEGSPGEDSAPPTVHTALTAPPPARATFSRSAVTRPVQAPASTPSNSVAPPAQPPAVSTPVSPSGRPVPPSAHAAREALLRELATRRSGGSIPPVSPSSRPGGSLRPPPGHSSSGFYSVRPEHARGSSSAPPGEQVSGGAGFSTSPPGRYSVQPEDRASAAGSDPLHNPAHSFDTPLSELIEEFARGSEPQRWCAARLHEAQHHEAMGEDQLAIGALQLAMAQNSDPRIRAERDRLQARSLKAASGVYRARAITEERQTKYKEAAASWGKVLEACPDDVEAAIHAASCCMEIGEIKQAGQHARRAVELAPENVAAHRLLLRFFRKAGMELNANREREILRKLAKY